MTHEGRPGATVPRAAGTLAVAGLAGLAARFTRARAAADRDWAGRVESRLTGIGEVAEVTILPLVERLTIGEAGHSRLRGEAGLSYLVKAGETSILFDTGLNLRGDERSPLVENADVLRVDLTALDGVVVSHLHPDHVGGLRMARRRTFGLSPAPLEPRGLPAYVPTEMTHDRADVVPISGPRVIAPGVAVLPPLPAVVFLGPVAEQAMVVNVRGFGLVVLTGCGHPPMERILGVTEQVLDVPIRAVVGGLHLPVHPWGTPFVPQAVLGNPHWPWQPIGERDAADVIEQIGARGPRVVALSGHDSTPWTFDAFRQAFGDGYRTMRVGSELRISAA
ncbi:MBL fold metallo-hydrolase [Blastococcus sp. VKM Ac-2987]|uniref:MBL fold metallo-hydrolase n=1 Tax=Blastococcus sp. VKM Ac-2987 TaxID=3004141 RepID=UPI0022ABB2AD|nr:MBL fold metallo-hydrolase [Blastococcus sp. VKM Ac-2987]MCZ2857482.1 MBL fold metallo-hydrolase [Blastococcus sp. VKM Ac-2987]